MRNDGKDQQTSAEQEGDSGRGEYLKQFVQLLTAAWPNNRVVNIVCHGHSVPAGYARSPEVRGLDSYPRLLHAEVMKRYPNAVVNVIVTAKGGESADQGALRFGKEVLRHAPDLVTIDYALNDRAIGLARARDAWVEMIEGAVGANAKVLLLTPTLDLRTELDKPDEILAQHAVQIRTLADAYKVGLVDSYSSFQHYLSKGGKLADLISDINHPNLAGHQLVLCELLKWF